MRKVPLSIIKNNLSDIKKYCKYIITFISKEKD